MVAGAEGSLVADMERDELEIGGSAVYHGEHQTVEAIGDGGYLFYVVAGGKCRDQSTELIFLKDSPNAVPDTLVVALIELAETQPLEIGIGEVGRTLNVTALFRLELI